MHPTIFHPTIFHPTIFHPDEASMARWPQNLWTTVFTYASIFVGFPLLSFLLWWWVRQGS